MDSIKTKREVDKRNSLVTGLRLIMGLIVVIMAVSFFFAVVYLIRQERIKTLKNEAENTLTTLEEGIHAEVSRYRELSRIIMLDKDLVYFLTTDPDNINVELKNQTRYSVMAILNVTTNVDSVLAFRNDGIFINTSRDIYNLDTELMADPEWLSEITKQMGGAVYSVNGCSVDTLIVVDIA